MGLPKTIQISGREWRVVIKPLAHRGLEGQCDYSKREIQIDSGLPVVERAEVFLHEVLHACLPEPWPTKAEETMVRRLAPRLLDALRSVSWAPKK